MVDETPETYALSIGALSEQTGCNIETIRYYERIAMLPPPPRSQGGHRLYGTGHADRLRFILRARGFGFSLEQARALLLLAERAQPTCDGARAIATQHRDEMRRKIAELQRTADELDRLVGVCGAEDDAACPILDALSGKARL